MEGNFNRININNFHRIKNISKLNKKNITFIVNSFFDYNKLSINYLDVNFLNSKEMLLINKKYLNHDYDTDVITFNLSLDKKEIIADIYINIEMLLYNTILFKTEINKELKRLIIHACLHLIGKKDKTEYQKKQMRIKEEFFINLIS